MRKRLYYVNWIVLFIAIVSVMLLGVWSFTRTNVALQTVILVSVGTSLAGVLSFTGVVAQWCTFISFRRGNNVDYRTFLNPPIGAIAPYLLLLIIVSVASMQILDNQRFFTTGLSAFLSGTAVLIARQNLQKAPEPKAAEHGEVFSAIAEQPVAIDEIAAETELHKDTVSTRIDDLEEDGLVASKTIGSKDIWHVHPDYQSYI